MENLIIDLQKSLQNLESETSHKINNARVYDYLYKICNASSDKNETHKKFLDFFRVLSAASLYNLLENKIGISSLENLILRCKIEKFINFDSCMQPDDNEKEIRKIYREAKIEGFVTSESLRKLQEKYNQANQLEKDTKSTPLTISNFQNNMMIWNLETDEMITKNSHDDLGIIKELISDFIKKIIFSNEETEKSTFAVSENKLRIIEELTSKIKERNEIYSKQVEIDRNEENENTKVLKYLMEYSAIKYAQLDIYSRNDLDGLFIGTKDYEFWNECKKNVDKYVADIDIITKNLHEAICRNTDYSFQLTHLKRTKNIKTSDFYGGFDLTNSEERMRVEKAVEYLFHALTKLEYIDNTLDNFYLFSCRLTGATPFGNQIDFTKLSWKGTSDIGKSDLYVLIRLAFNSNSRNEYKSNKSIKVGNNTYGMYTKCKRFFEFADGSTYPSKIDNKLERYCSEDIKIICNQFIENLK